MDIFFFLVAMIIIGMMMLVRWVLKQPAPQYKSISSYDNHRQNVEEQNTFYMLRTDECKEFLLQARERLSNELFRQANLDDEVFEAAEKQFKDAWKKTVCLAKSKYGESIVFASLHRLSFKVDI